VKRLLIVPAAGRGTRLGWDGPKVLCPVGGRPMIDYLLERYRGVVDRIVVVVAPAAQSIVRGHLDEHGAPADCAVQAEPTGMIPAILSARSFVDAYQPRQVWITWCDQIAISGQTVGRLIEETDRAPAPALTFPTVRQQPPYIHFIRDSGGRIVQVRQRREGDEMPDVGESDAGIFALQGDAYEQLIDYAALAPADAGTHELNFLPFIPWLAARRLVRTFDLVDPREAVGVNTPEDRRAVEAYLRGRA
jgi:bifunctional UDP-N-acetylglucosamine pyrophosphorylase / glucosamine-1-phosphate N-acetyltransferase